MLAVIFEVMPDSEGKQEYLDIAADLRDHLGDIDGFISIERFQSLVNPDKILSLSFWENEEAIAQWRNLEKHRSAQSRGRNELFSDYRIRIGEIVRDYSMSEREQAPVDSRQVHAE